MTNDQIRRKIAEACGWKDFTTLKDSQGKTHPAGRDPTYSFTQFIPKYTTSHDAMAEAVGTLKEWEVKDFVHSLCKCIGCLPSRPSHFYSGDLFMLVVCSPLQKAEAFLKAKGLWEGGGE